MKLIEGNEPEHYYPRYFEPYDDNLEKYWKTISILKEIFEVDK